MTLTETETRALLGRVADELPDATVARVRAQHHRPRTPLGRSARRVGASVAVAAVATVAVTATRSGPTGPGPAVAAPAAPAARTVQLADVALHLPAGWGESRLAAVLACRRLNLRSVLGLAAPPEASGPVPLAMLSLQPPDGGCATALLLPFVHRPDGLARAVTVRGPGADAQLRHADGVTQLLVPLSASRSVAFAAVGVPDAALEALARTALAR